MNSTLEPMTINTSKPASQQKLTFDASENLYALLASLNIGLVFSSYQSGKLFALGRNTQNKRLSIVHRNFEYAMGLATLPNGLLLANKNSIIQFENILKPGALDEGFDCVLIPQNLNHIGDVMPHDVVYQSKTNTIFFANTRFNCVASPSNQKHFSPYWIPPCITKFAPEDSCHIAGLALRDEQLRYATVVAQTDHTGNWRDHKMGGGVIYDLTNDLTVCEQLSMPHSPRWYHNRLWVLNSGRGGFGYVDFELKRFRRVALCPGFLRGLAFAGEYAIVGVSKVREKNLADQLHIIEKLHEHNIQPKCGLLFINLKTGVLEGHLFLEGGVTELYDIAVMHGVTRPNLLSFHSDNLGEYISYESSICVSALKQPDNLWRCRNLQPVDVTDLKNALAELTPEEWQSELDIQAKFAPGRDVETIYFHYNLKEPKAGEPLEVLSLTQGKFWQRLGHYITQITDEIIANHFNGRAKVMRSMVAKLSPNSKIDAHYDTGALLTHCHRIHVPIITHDKIEFIVRGEKVIMESGQAYELNNTVRHSVANGGTHDRLHLIFDVLTTSS